ncbi:MAG TPA: SpoIIE family protein phosphatase [Gemmatimonadales bacterium]|nr:SpoIIE family protein phosphatase [Gemmatimonadales bacterium]
MHEQPTAAPVTPALEWGVAARTNPGHAVSGDSYVVQPFAGGVLVAVVDALGHGEEAAAAAARAVQAIAAHAADPVLAVTRWCHESLVGTRGAVLSLASFATAKHAMSWLGVGNVEGVLLRGPGARKASRAVLINRGGIVGAELPAPRDDTLSVAPGDTLIFATDGVRGGFADGLVPTGPPQQIADSLLQRFAKGTDDALVLVARYLGGGSPAR